MAEAPRSRADLERESMFVLIGDVTAVRPGPGDAAEADLTIVSNEKFLVEALEGAVTLHYRDPAAAGGGGGKALTGALGQHAAPVAGQRGRAYVDWADGGAQLLEPNGWEPLG